jgi:hypothetical protein
MANSRVQQESKMQQQYYGVNTHPVMTTKAKIYKKKFKNSCIENNFLQEINNTLGCYLNHNFSN